MTFQNEYQVEIKDLDKNNNATNKAILGYLEDIACLHSATVGYGPDDVKRTKKAWLLLDWKLEVIKRPHFGDKIKVITWAREKEVCSTYRDFKILNNKNELMVKATSKWILYDLNINRISKIEDDLINLYKPESNSVFEERKLEKLKEPENNEMVLEYKTKRLDIDMNDHMHNLNYLGLAYEALPENVFYKQEFMNVRITYKKQIKINDEVKCLYSKNDNKHIITIKSFDDKIIHAIIELY